MTSELHYVVLGRPVTWERKRLDTRRGRKRTFTSDEQIAAMQAHALAATAALGRGRASWSLDGAFSIDVVGYWPDATVGDSDRLTSLAMDALEGVAYRTDRQVRAQSGRVVSDGSPERVEVTVRRLEVDPVEVTVRRLEVDPVVRRRRPRAPRPSPRRIDRF